MNAASSADLPERVLRLVKQLVAGLPVGSSALEIADSTRSGRREVIATLTPQNQTSAPMTVHAEESVPVIDVILGKGGFYELRIDETDHSGHEPLDELRALFFAVVDGRYHETIWMKGGEVVRSHGVATVGSKRIPVHWRQLFTNPLRRARRCTREYQSYDAVPHDITN